MHIHATTQASLIECMPKMHPMGGARPSCFAVNFNCQKIGITATEGEVRSTWDKFDRRTVVKLIVLHCPSFEVPETFREFEQLQEIRVYNSTIVRWGTEAAVTNDHHSKLKTVSVVRVNMTDGLLPLGLQSPAFPKNFFETSFCETNLRNVPENLDAKWNIGSSIFVENSMMTYVPPALIRLQPSYLVVGGNPISELPPELFEIEGMIRLGLGRTSIQALPRNVLHPVKDPPITETNISFFWSWFDTFAEASLDASSVIPLLAGGSPYCSDLDRITNGAATTFSAPFQSEYSALFMNSSESNWGLLLHLVDCSSPSMATVFPMDQWDELYSLQLQSNSG